MLGLLSLGFRYYVVSDQNFALWATLPSYFSWFALGMAMAVISVGPVAPRLVAFVTVHPAACWLVAALGYVLLSLRAPGGSAARHVLHDRRVDVPARRRGRGRGGARRAGRVRRGGGRLAAPGHGVALAGAAAGLVSYGVYLWQGAWVEQVANWASSWGFAAGHRLFPVELVVVAAGSIACAAMSYRLVERPLMRFKYRRRSSPPRDRRAVASPVADG